MVCIANKSSSSETTVSKVTSSTGFKKANKAVKKELMEREYASLRSLLPRVASKEVSSLDVVLEAIEYIQSLEHKLLLNAEDGVNGAVAVNLARMMANAARQ